MRVPFCAVVVVLVVFASAPASARDLYRSIISVDADVVVRTTNSLLDLEELFDDDALSDLFPSYIPGVSEVEGLIDLRGLGGRASYAANSTSLRLQVPVAGIDVTFDGANRDESQEMFESWLAGKSVPGVTQAVTSLLTALVEHSSVEPVAGNPNSLQSRMFDADFGLGTLGPFLKDFPDPSERIPSLFKIDGEFGHFSAGPYSGQTYGVELGFGWNFMRRLALVTDLDALFSLVEGEATVGQGSFGLGLQGRILDWWNVALVARGGLVGSFDLGAVAAMYSVSAVNHMRVDWNEFRIDMKNMVGVANTLDGLEIDGIELDYDVTNVVLKNGLDLSREFSVGSWSRALRGKLFWVDSHYFVDDLWLEHSDEIGLGVGLASKSGVRTYDPINLDVSYVVGQSYDGLRLRLSLRF